MCAVYAIYQRAYLLYVRLLDRAVLLGLQKQVLHGAFHHSSQVRQFWDNELLYQAYEFYVVLLRYLVLNQ